jgi:solute carrier family 25 (mitochondrial S-adenosylmethionine transporter), member 26
VARDIIKEEGKARLFSGIGPRIAWITLGGGIFFGVYEKTKSVFFTLPHVLSSSTTSE